MTVTVASFRQQFNAFTDPGVYDADAITFYINLGYVFLNSSRWSTVLDYGVSLFVAHHMILAARDNATTKAGGIAGAVQGVLNSKSVDKVSAGYDTGAVTLENAAFWNMTTYGIRFLQIARQMGSGGMQVNGHGGQYLGYGGYGYW